MSTLELKFTGNKIKPEGIKAREIAEVITAFEDILAEIVAHEYAHVKKEDIAVSLVGIQRGSIGLQFAPPLPQVVLAAEKILAPAIETGNFDTLPYLAIEPLKKIAAFTQHHECNADFYSVNGTYRLLATITPETEIKTAAPLTGETIIYGQVLRVGGRKPKVTFEPLGGKVLYCSTSRKIAKSLALKLYTWAAVSGIAQWNSYTLELEEFEIHTVIDYQPQPVTAAFAELAQIAGKYYADVSDVNAYVAGIRGEPAED